MEVENLDIEGLKVLTPRVFRDARGYFCETYNRDRYVAAGIDAAFVQDNESFSQKGVVRGLHWQAAPHTQAKLVRVIRGAVWDVAVDIRQGSPTYGQHAAVLLVAADSQYAKDHPEVVPGRQFFIPKGFAHGFVVLEDDTLFSYKCDALYCPASERGLRFDDPALGIAWPDIGCPILLSEKDQKHPPLSGIEPWAM